MPIGSSNLADESHIAFSELAFQYEEKGKRAAELVIANEELLFQNEEKEKRAAELVIANKELAFQNEEKGKRAQELILANIELAFQNEEKGKRAQELILANEELLFQNGEKEKRAAELIIANEELLFQNSEKEKRAAELIIANKELLAFTYVSSHDLQEPLRKIQTFSRLIIEKESEGLSERGIDYFQRIQSCAARMQELISDLLAYSRINVAERAFEFADLNRIIEDVTTGLADTIKEKAAILEVDTLGTAHIIPFQFRQLMYNLVSNALKFSIPGIPPHITIKGTIVNGNTTTAASLLADKEYYHLTVQDNGIGFSQEYTGRIFEVFQKLHGKDEYAGTGIGLAIAKKIVESHNGVITASSIPGNGARFDIYIPAA